MVEVALTRWHCRAMNWWLRHEYLPFLLREARLGNPVAKPDLLNAIYLIQQFSRFFERRLRGSDQDREALRTLKRTHANWLAGFIDTRPENAPPILKHSGDIPSPEELEALPLGCARAIIFGVGVYEVMRACRSKVRAKRVGRNPIHRTIEQANAFVSGDEKNSGDERYERRVRQIARERADFEDAIRRCFEANVPDLSKIPPIAYPSQKEKTPLD